MPKLQQIPDDHWKNKVISVVYSLHQLSEHSLIASLAPLLLNAIYFVGHILT